MQLLKGVVRSFYSRAFYLELARSWRGIGFGFIVILSLINTVGWSAIGYMGLHQVIEQVPGWAETLPSVTYKNGEISIDKPVPYYVRAGNSGPIMGVIDTNYKVTDINALTAFMKQNKIVFLLTADKFISLQKAGELEVRDLKESFKQPQPLTITHDNWQMWGKRIERWGTLTFLTAFSLILFVTLLIGNFFITVLDAIVIALLGLIFRAGLEFSAAMRLAAAVRIPLAAISFLCLVAGHPFVGMLSWLLWLGYLVFAVWASKPKPGNDVAAG